MRCVNSLVPAKKTVGDLVSELGVDGELSQFWVFASGLLNGEQCETLLSALATEVEKGTMRPENSRRLMLLLDCYAESESKLQYEKSGAITSLFVRRGLVISLAHLSIRQMQVVSDVICQYSTELEKVDLTYMGMDDMSSIFQITASLWKCERLKSLILPYSAFSPKSTCSFILPIIHGNTDSLISLYLPIGDNDFPQVSPVVQNCTFLASLDIGSPSLTNAGSLAVVSILQAQSTLVRLGLSGVFNDEGFSPIAQTVCSMSENLTHFELALAELSPAKICSTLSSILNLTVLGLYEIHIGDDGLRQLAQQLATIREVRLYNVGLTSLSMPTLDKLLHTMPVDGVCQVAVQRSLFLSTGQGIDDILAKTSLKLTSRETFRRPISVHRLQIRDMLELQTGQGQRLSVII